MTAVRLIFRLLVVSIILLPCLADSQVTGTPPLSTSSGGPFDSVDLANLDVHLTIPVFSRAGKGIPFVYNLVYDSLVWSPKNSNGQQAWTPFSNWGWSPQTTAATGYLTNATQYKTCHDVQHRVVGHAIITTNWRYNDVGGTSHFFSGQLVEVDDPGTDCPSQTDTFTRRAIDRSGYFLYASQIDSSTVTGPNGVNYTPPVNPTLGNQAASLAEPNGNTISVSANGTITDTLGTTALTVSNTSPPADLVFTYTAPATAATVTVKYVQYSIATNFQVSGTAEYCYPNGCPSYLVDRILLPDGKQYVFTYEATAGLPQKVTGRLASVTLPTGGNITYGYGTNVNSMMADGSPSTLTRTLGGGTWSYLRSIRDQIHTQQTQTSVTEPNGGVTDFFFSDILQTAKSVYTDGTRGTFLDYSFTCYNGNFTSCATAIVDTGIYVNRRTTYDYPDNNAQQKYTAVDSAYDQYGNLLSETDYDLAAGGNPVLRIVNLTYNAPNLCSSYKICDRPDSRAVRYANSNLASYTLYVYDENSLTHGSLTTLSHWISGTGNYIATHYTYNSDGTINTSQGLNLTTTTYSYTSGSCNNAFPTSTSVPSPLVGNLVTSYTYNCAGAVVKSATDPNGGVVSRSYTLDRFYWRPESSTDQLGNVTNYSYLSVFGQVEAAMTFNGSLSTVDTVSTPDSLGRPYLQQTRQGPGSANFDTVETDYDASGNVSKITVPFTSTLGLGDNSKIGVTTTYDALHRPLLVTDAGGGTTGYSYTVNDALVTISGTPTTRRANGDGRSGKVNVGLRDNGGHSDGVCAEHGRKHGLYDDLRLRSHR